MQIRFTMEQILKKKEVALMLESKRKAIIFISLSLLLAAIAGFMFLQKVKALNTNLGEMVEVYVASGNIPSRTVIQPEQLETMELPKKFANDSYITDKSELVNQVSIVPLAKDNIITGNMLKPIEEKRESNNRLVSIYSSENINFDQHIEGEDRVDIIVSRDVKGKPETEIFMEDVAVAHSLGNDDDKFMGILVEITPEDATKLIHMENYATSIRILKANVGKTEEDINEDETRKKEEEAAEKQRKQAEEKEKNEAEKAEKEKKDKKEKKKQEKKKKD